MSLGHMLWTRAYSRCNSSLEIFEKEEAGPGFGVGLVVWGCG